MASTLDGCSAASARSPLNTPGRHPGEASRSQSPRSADAAHTARRAPVRGLLRGHRSPRSGRPASDCAGAARSLGVALRSPDDADRVAVTGWAALRPTPARSPIPWAHLDVLDDLRAGGDPPRHPDVAGRTLAAPSQCALRFEVAGRSSPAHPAEPGSPGLARRSCCAGRTRSTSRSNADCSATARRRRLRLWCRHAARLHRRSPRLGADGPWPVGLLAPRGCSDP